MDDDAPESPSQINDFIPQKLIIEPNTLELNGLTEETPHDLPKNTAKGRDEEDFPLDYFPVSVEYPTEENAFDPFPPQAFTPAAPSMPISYDNVNERDSMPVNSLLNRYPYQLSVAPTFPVPPSSSRQHFMTNRDFYSSNNNKEKLVSPSDPTSYMKYDEPVMDFDESRPNENCTNAKSHNSGQQTKQHQLYSNNFQQSYPNGMVPGYYPKMPYNPMGDPLLDQAFYGADDFSFHQKDVITICCIHKLQLHGMFCPLKLCNQLQPMLGDHTHRIIDRHQVPRCSHTCKVQIPCSGTLLFHLIVREHHLQLLKTILLAHFILKI